jgi:deoxycytidylate deaminase
MNYIQRGFRLAKNMTEFSDYVPQKIGAVIMSSHRPVATGWNVKKTNPMQSKYNTYRGFSSTPGQTFHRLHAESMAIINMRKIGIDPEGCEIFIFRKFRSGETALAKPCAACMAMLKEHKIKKIYYSISNDEYGVIENK